LSAETTVMVRRALEVILFAATEPISAYQIAQLLTDRGFEAEEGAFTPGRVEKLIEQLVLDWEAEERPLTVLRIAGGYQMATRPEWADLVAKLMEDKRSQRLSRAALETLAIVAYKQPVIRPDIDAIRGVNSDSSLKTLLEKGLVTIAGRDEGPGRPLLYKTTPEFLKYFGLNSLADLPEQGELAALLGPLTTQPAEGAATAEGDPAAAATGGEPLPQLGLEGSATAPEDGPGEMETAEVRGDDFGPDEEPSQETWAASPEDENEDADEGGRSDAGAS
jgi:segregation and condensation protein B